ncbi:hypothetical protein B0I35DRAFT_463737 [Stachybotrys elegans]|uniref:Uncharacterized protein n=1 Tax=Stachybotrys elegans TaxID=80388 RepID=A0A8K0WM03_9HYPO|nr:hypothetical protein B0I35DRAFT_463737 [Stachybotrys elegans]
MPSFKTTVSAVATLALVQVSSAHFLAIPAATAAGIGAVSNAVSAASAVAGTVTTAIQNGQNRRSVSRVYRRQEQNQLAWQLCREELGTATVTFSGPAPGSVLAEGIPPSCMTLATVITGEHNQGSPIPMGSDSILFQNLSNEEIMEIQAALDAHP